MQGAGAMANYPHTIKKKSSKANMLLDSGQQPHVNHFMGGSQGGTNSLPR